MFRGLRATSFLLAVLCVAVCGCGSGSGNGGQPSVAITPKPQSVAAGTQTTFSATISNVSQSSSTVAWYVTPAFGGGTLSAPQTNGLTSSVTYTAPASAPSANTIIITAYSVTDRSAYDSTTFAISGSALPVLQTTPPPVGTVGVAYPSTTLQATNGTAPYTWTVNAGLGLGALAGNLPPGMSLSSDGTLSGTPTSAGSFPVNIQITDSLMNSSQSQLVITVNFAVQGTCGAPVGNEAALNGQYAFVLQGTDTVGPSTIIGSFTADGTGNVTSGQEDRNINNTYYPVNYSFDPTASNFTLDSHGRGCLTLTTSAGTFLYRLSAILDGSGNVSNGYLMAFDNSGVRVQGTFAQQDPSAFSTNQISGNYAFGVASDNPSKGRFAAVGSFAASSGTLSGDIDTNQTGNVDGEGVITSLTNSGTTNYMLPISPLSFTGGYSIASDGRGTMTFNLPPTGTQTTGTTIGAVAYVVSATEVFLMSSNTEPTPLFIGRMVQQSGAPYSTSSLSGNMVRYMGGLSTVGGSGVTGGSREELALFSASSGTFYFTNDYNDGGSVGNIFGLGGTFQIDPGSGRVPFTYSIISSYDQPICYVYGLNEAFCMGTTPNTSFGELLPQTTASFSSSTFSGVFAFGTVQSPSVNGNLQVGAAGVSAPSRLTILTDNNAPGSILTLGTLTTPGYSISTTGTGGLGTSVIYAVSPQLWLTMEEGTVTDPTVTFYQQ
jgi:large repetitive protein